ncbi:MAG: GPR endopeptidase [Oscillospiraceae bacterium]|nr:GPR endopeptidase [Oscillospiraceae bacterium]
MIEKRTDLAVEARELWDEKTGGETEVEGIEISDRWSNGFKITAVRIKDERGSKILCKPIGRYSTVFLDAFLSRSDESFNAGAETIAEEIRAMAGLKDGDTVLVVGLGNRFITPDAVGPQTVKSTLATRHLIGSSPEEFRDFRPVAAIETGVLGSTGIESAEMIRALTDKLSPDCVIAVDALASRSVDRVCRTVQITDTGIVPGSGVGNAREEINEKTLGVKVIAVGVPTVVDAATMCAQLIEETGGSADETRLRRAAGDMIVMPREIDQRVADISKMVGYGINLALHGGISVDDITMFLG